MVSDTAIDATASAIGFAAGAVGTMYAEKQIVTEDDFTSRLLDRIETNVEGMLVDGFRWRAMKLLGSAFRWRSRSCRRPRATRPRSAG